MGKAAFSADKVCVVMSYSGITDPEECQVIWAIFAKKKRNIVACQHYIMKGITDYGYNRQIRDTGIYLEQNTMKSILELQLNLGRGLHTFNLQQRGPQSWTAGLGQATRQKRSRSRNWH